MGDVDRNQIAEMDEKSERRWLNRGRLKNNTAEDKDAKKSKSITITNDKGRRSQEEIIRMVREAEMFPQEDEKIKERIGAKNRFENYVHNMKSTIDDKDELADRIESDDKETMESALKEAMEWLDDNQKAEKEDYDDEKLKELEQVCNPIIRKVYEKSWQRSF